MNKELTDNESPEPRCFRCKSFRGVNIGLELKQYRKHFDDREPAWFYIYQCPRCMYITTSHNKLSMVNLDIFRKTIKKKYLKLKQYI